MKKILFFGSFMFILFPAIVLAEAWWGDGARPKKWVLKHGGTIINFNIVNYDGSKEEYKAVMYDKEGHFTEVEFGTSGMFDDARNGTYIIKAKRDDPLNYGNKDRDVRGEGDTFASAKVIAHPGESINIKFDYKKRKAKIVSEDIKIFSVQSGINFIGDVAGKNPEEKSRTNIAKSIFLESWDPEKGFCYLDNHVNQSLFFWKRDDFFYPHIFIGNSSRKFSEKNEKQYDIFSTDWLKLSFKFLGFN
jgi:hypothetical protein